MNDPYFQYYHQQAGSGVGNIYYGAAYQKGHGIGSFLGGLFRSALPLIKKGAKAVGKEMLKTGVNVLGDVVDKTPLKQSLQSRISDARSNLKRKAETKLKEMIGSGYQGHKHFKRNHSASGQRTGRTAQRKKRSSANTNTKKTTKRNRKKIQITSDIFD